MADAIGSEQVEEALKSISSSDAKEAAGGLEVALQIESESIDFYSKQAEKFAGKEVEHFFKFLVGQEKEHLRAIESLKNSLEKGGGMG